MWKISNEIAFAFVAIVLLLASSGSGIFWYRSNYAPLYDPPHMLKFGIFAAQVRSQRVPQTDADGDGTGEFVLLLDLMDHDIIERLSIQPDGEIAQYNGYYYRIYLPKSATEGTTQASQVDVNIAETRWIAYAWPMELPDSPNSLRCFAITQTGYVYATGPGWNGEAPKWHDLFGKPDWSAAPDVSNTPWRPYKL